MILPLSIFGCHTLKPDLHILGNLFVYNHITAIDFRNSHGILTINDVSSNQGVIGVQKNNGVADFLLNYDDTLQIVDGKLSIVPKIITNADIDLRAPPNHPIKIVYDNTEDAGAEIRLDYSDKDFTITDTGTLQTVDLDLKGQGAMTVRKADLSLGEYDDRWDLSATFTRRWSNPILPVGLRFRYKLQFYIRHSYYTVSPFYKINRVLYSN